MAKMLVLLAAYTTLIFSAKCYSADVYQWTDSNGKKHYSDQKPKDTESQLILRKGMNSAELPSRDNASMQKALNDAKGKIFAIYNKSLKINPNTNGSITFDISVDANGEVINISILESNLNNHLLEEQMSNELKNVNFGKEKVKTTSTKYSVTFLPL